MSVFSWFRLDEREQKNFFWLLLVYGLYILPLILANAYYMDDNGRAVAGYAAWEFDGRPLTMLVIDILNFQWTFLVGIPYKVEDLYRPIQDLAPYPLILGTAIFAYAVVLTSRKYLQTESLLLRIGCQALCIMNPFLLGCLAYRFDSVTMLLAAALTLLCFALPAAVSPKKMLLWGFFLAFFVLCLYQLVIGAWIALTAMEILVALCRAENMRFVLQRCMARLAGCFVAGLLYKFTIMKFMVQTYQKDLQSFLMPFSHHGWELLRQNIHVYHLMLRAYTDHLPWVVGGAMLVIFFLFSWHWFRQCKLGGKMVVIYVVGVLIVLFGGYLPLLALSGQANHACSLIFLIVVALALGSMLCILAERRKVLAFLLVPLLMYGCYYDYAFGNVLKRQTEHEIMIVQQISYDIQRMDYEGSHPGRTAELPKITLIGSAQPSLEFLVAAKRQPLMANLLESNLMEDHSAWILLRRYLPFDFQPGFGKEEMEACHHYADAHDPVLVNSAYAIYLDGGHIIVKFL